MALNEFLNIGGSFFPCIIASGTMRDCDATIAILDLLTHEGDGDTKIEADALQSLIPAEAFDNDPMQSEWWATPTAQNVADRAWDLAEEAAPEGWYFGRSPADPADLGYFPITEED